MVIRRPRGPTSVRNYVSPQTPPEQLADPKGSPPPNNFLSPTRTNPKGDPPAQLGLNKHTKHFLTSAPRKNKPPAPLGLDQRAKASTTRNCDCCSIHPELMGKDLLLGRTPNGKGHSRQSREAATDFLE